MKARVIVTLECNRNCENCCNTSDSFLDHKVLTDIHDLLKYEEIIITGGEPMLITNELICFVDRLRFFLRYSGKIYIYTALYNRRLLSGYWYLLQKIDGIHFTIHHEATDQEVQELKQLSHVLADLNNGDKSFRLSIDSRLFDRYDFSNIDFSGWSVVRRMKWQVNCMLPEDEELLIYELKESEKID